MNAEAPASNMKKLAENIIVFLEASDVAVEKYDARDGYQSWEEGYAWADKCIPVMGDAYVDDFVLIPEKDEMMFWPNSVPLAIMEDGSERDGWGAGSIQVSHYQPCGAAVARKFGAGIFGTKMALHRVVAVTPDGSRRAFSSPVVNINGKWLSAKRPRLDWGYNKRKEPMPVRFVDLNKEDDGKCHDQRFKLAEGVMLGLRYRWTVTLRIGGSVGVRLPLRSCAAIPELFKLRDVPAGKARRSKLRHWVETHWRASSNNEDSDMLTLVRKHLRGGTKFSWSGMDVEIDPADYDIERLEEIKAWRLDP